MLFLVMGSRLTGRIIGGLFRTCYLLHIIYIPAYLGAYDLLFIWYSCNNFTIILPSHL